MDKNEPIQYKRGWIEFFKLKFKVTPDVLIPRPETELLVEEVIKFVTGSSLLVNSSTRKNETRVSSYEHTILDLGTGSGAIAISLAKNLPNVNIIASEVSPKALEIAKLNAKFHQVEDRIEFKISDLLSSINSELLTLNSELIIVTNLPYIPGYRIPYLDSSVKDFEPHVALDGGSDGFDLYRKLFQQINEKGWKPKLILGEIDYTQGDTAYIEATNHFPDAQVEVKTDLAHLQRILTIRL